MAEKELARNRATRAANRGVVTKIIEESEGILENDAALHDVKSMLQSFCFSVKYCFKSSLVSDHHSNFLRDRDHFLGQKLNIFFCFLFPVSDHPT